MSYPPPPSPGSSGSPYPAQPYPAQPYPAQPMATGYAGGPPPAKGGGKTWLWILLGVLLLLLLCCGGTFAACSAGIVGASSAASSGLESYSSSSSVSANKPGGVNNPLTVSEGDSFTIGDLSFASGWQLKDEEYLGKGIPSMTVTNNGSSSESVYIDVMFYEGSTKLSDEISCSASVLAPGESGQLNCAGHLSEGQTYDTIKVAEAY